MLTIRELENRFTYHKPTGKNQVKRYEEIRRSALNFAEFLFEFTPESREQSLAIGRLEEVVFWANAAIARNE
ncbi:MAG: hypothetical protein JRJ39_00370 [Deltaproteobacteria bacterium]|nr:hypothetical protein [Deltaproteobacteria bacterium]MBW1845562.1 hypothetical protein [Deltaproteobacteria bacterium]MBW2031992.1 hypothetical protein [Deltaproteobacteria bacterium]